ncbi:MADS-box protein SOC1-like [Impatiens glandulifera]|uniref:MADS-box protein SOC1-like n=1 Tax=Impatiens glandulifera TaxID=253017 RepID=UPI001FB132DD|nr:MADS-box protein SOC1-like [Impatiens glandulifera]
MVRGKTQMRRIENATSRQVTFSKRRNGLLKKAFELSVLCDAKVALIVFSPKGKLYEFASSSMQDIIERYKQHTKDIRTENIIDEEKSQNLKREAESLGKKIEFLEDSKRKMLGECVASSTFEELQQLEQQLDRSVTCIRARKMQVFQEQIEKLKAKEVMLVAENEMLSEKYNVRVNEESMEKRVTIESSEEDEEEEIEVDTGLFIGQAAPESSNRRRKNKPIIMMPN